MSKQCDMCKYMYDDWRDLKRDVGFFSRYSYMPQSYEPLVDRVQLLESKLEALLEHLHVDIELNKTVVKDSK